MANEMNETNETEIVAPETSEIEVNTILVDPESLVIRSIMPGILTSMVCRIRGGRKTWRDNVREQTGPNGEEIKEWQAGRKVDDPVELKAADKLRARVDRAVKKLGVVTAVGLIVPAHKKQELAQTIMACQERIKGWNAKSKTCDLSFRYVLHSIENNSAGTIGAVTDQLHMILQTVNDAIRDDDQKILEGATKHQLGAFSTAAEVMAASPEQRIAIVAKIRADRTRKAIAEARSFSTLLPEEAGLAVTDMVATIRKSAVAWVKASKEGDDAYQKAINAVDLDGISAMQAALVQAAVMADSKAEEETALAAGTPLYPVFFDEADDEDEAAIG